jgi:hypothetical protein
MPFNGHTIIDGDGHVIEDTRAIIGFMPQIYRDKYETHTFFNPFPPLDQQQPAYGQHVLSSQQASSLEAWC